MSGYCLAKRGHCTSLMECQKTGDCQLLIDKKEEGKPHPHPVYHPPHYISHPSGIECITITRHMNFNLGNAVKYIWRAGEKGGEGNKVEDLEKAIWYLRDEVERLLVEKAAGERE